MAGRTLDLPRFLAEELFPSVQRTGTVPGLGEWSNLQRSALFALPVKHGFVNIPTLNAIGPGGIKAAVRGFRMMPSVGPDAENELARMGASGITTHTQSPFGKVGQWSQNVTSRADTAQRLALHRTLLENNPVPPGYASHYRDLTPYQQGQVIQDRLVDYTRSSPLIDKLRSLGSNFPLWRLTLPSLAAKALVRNPRAVGGLARAEQAYNEARGNTAKGYETEFALPTDEGVGAAFEPASYFLNTANLVNAAYHHGNLQDEIAGIRSGKVANLLLGVAPGGYLGTEALNAYHSKAPTYERLLLALMGAYDKNLKSPYAQRVEQYRVENPAASKFEAQKHGY